jgi:mono/diheme cytochrome c family protein
MKLLRSVLPIFAVLAFFGLCAPAQDKQVKKVPPRPTAAIGGKELFGEYCAVCHGPDGKGGGPAADALKQRPTDLTHMSRQNKGSFPEERFLKILNGETTYPSHGSHDMPIWGAAFRNMSPSVSLAQDRMHSLLNYVEEMQVK